MGGSPPQDSSRRETAKGGISSRRLNYRTDGTNHPVEYRGINGGLADPRPPDLRKYSHKCSRVAHTSDMHFASPWCSSCHEAASIDGPVHFLPNQSTRKAFLGVALEQTWVVYSRCCFEYGRYRTSSNSCIAMSTIDEWAAVCEE
mgnify:FL=1